METMKYSVRGLRYRFNDKVRSQASEVASEVDAEEWDCFSADTIYTDIEDAVFLSLAVPEMEQSKLGRDSFMPLPRRGYWAERTADGVTADASRGLTQIIGTKLAGIKLRIKDRFWNDHA